MKGKDEEGNPIKYEDLTEAEQRGLSEFYDSVDLQNERKMMLMAREGSVQFVYQKALILYQFVFIPILELEQNDPLIKLASAKWIIGLAFQIFSIMLSGYSTFDPIIATKKFNGFKNNKKVGLVDYVSQLFLIIIHFIFATGTVYLLKVKYIY